VPWLQLSEEAYFPRKAAYTCTNPAIGGSWPGQFSSARAVRYDIFVHERTAYMHRP